MKKPIKAAPLRAARTLAVATIVVAAAVASSSAAGAATTCKLDIINNLSNPTLNTVRVDCALGETGLVYNSFNLYGADTWYDDSLGVVGRAIDSPYTGPTRIEKLGVNGFDLDEDWGRDEVYAKARIRRSNGTTFTVTTNTVVREFSY